MRKAVWALALAGLALTRPAWAQQQVSSFLGSFNGQPIQNQMIDMSNLAAPIPKPPSVPFSLASLIPHFSIPGFPLLPSTSPFPAPSTFPSTSYPNSFQPQAPFTPQQ